MTIKDKGKNKPDSPSEGLPERRTCGTQAVHERLLRTAAGYAEARSQIENYCMQAAMRGFVARSGCTKIPVVVHVVYRTATENISDAQIDSQIEVLNKDFRMQNADISSVPSPFQPLTADPRIMFELATVDPDGNPTDGITRTSTTVNGFTDDDAVKSSSTGGADPWPSNKYLNIWVCKLAGGLLGYAQFPGGPSATDGVVITHTGFGTTGTAAAPFNLGRTATHEIGHWLNLRHIWGDDGTGCAGSDFVADTPNQGGPNYGTPTFPRVTCNNGPNGDLFMNYMDYVDDSAMVMFTAGQVSRIHLALDGPRSNIGTTVPCGGPKPPPKDLPKDGPKEFPKDPPKEFPKDPPKDFPKDPPKEFPKDGPKDFPKDIIKEFPKDGPKDFPKDVIKEFPKDGPKDFPKDIIKEFPKDGPKDFKKEGAKDFVKDPGFDPGPGKPPVFDPPKGVMDPPKSFLEPPIDFPNFPQVHPVHPVHPVNPVSPGVMPFVLMTPFNTGLASSPQSEQKNALAASYLQLMGYYSSLYASGLLDANGMAAWQQVVAAYQQLNGQ